MIRPAQRIANTSPYYFADKLASIRAMEDNGIDVINLGIGSPDLAPPASVIDVLRSEASDLGQQSYQPYRGIPALRSALAHWYQSQFATEVDPATEVLPLLGSKEGLMHICMAFINEGDKVLLPNPGYPAYRAVVTIAGGIAYDYHLNPANQYFPDLDSLPTDAKMIFINYPHMPTGATVALEQLEELVAWARAHNVLIVHDNPYSHILTDQQVSIMQLSGAKTTSIELTSLSKNYNMAGWRVGFAVGDASLIDPMLTFKSNMDSGMYRPIQQAAATALAMGKAWFEEQNKVYGRRKVIAQAILDEIGCSYRSDTAGLFVWAKTPSGITGEALSDRLLDTCHVFCTPGFIFGSEGKCYVRLSLCAEESRLEQALQRIKKHPLL